MSRDQIIKSVTDDAVFRFLQRDTRSPEEYQYAQARVTPADMGQWFIDNLDYLAPQVRAYLEKA